MGWIKSNTRKQCSVVQVVADNMDNVKAVSFALTAAMAVKLVPTVIATSIQLAQLALLSVRAGC